jgi:predicted phage terminase large subunit-like protein
MTPHEAELIRKALPTMPLGEKVRLLELLEEYEKRTAREKAQKSLLAFVKAIQPDYKIGPHHRILAKKLEAAARGELDRIAVSIAPRFGKSHLLSYYFPAWFIGNYPTQKLIISSHTADLAVDFGKKVRNLIASDEYKSIFPNTDLAADAKSAGRWNTSKNGEFFACIRLQAKVVTQKGRVFAAGVEVGDVLFNGGRGVRVLDVYHSTHKKTYLVAGLECSEKHPIWTMNRGWVFAGEILSDDLLRTESFWDTMKALFWRAYGYLEHTFIPALVQHQGTLRESAQREVRGLWWPRNFAVRAVAALRQLHCGYGAAAFASAYSRAHRQQRTIQSGELSLGDAGATSQQQTHERSFRRQDTGAACKRYKHYAGSAKVSVEFGNGSARPEEETAKELEAYGTPENLGWIAGSIARVYARCCRKRTSEQPRLGAEEYLASFRETARKLCGVLLGVRTAGNVRITSTEKQPFVNFLVDGDHTFFAGGVLTHNCGVGGAIAGRGADLLIVDDPFSEQDVLNGNYTVFDRGYEWYAYGARTRLMPGGRVVVLHTRWAKNDLIGRLVEESAKNPDADQWDYTEFPAIINEGTDDEKSLWPEQWSIEALRRTRASMPTFQWQSQYQQSPTSQEGAVIKREWWKRWKKSEPPPCEYIIMALDAAQETNNRSDFTALTTWGVFYRENEDTGDQIANIMLLNAINKRVEFPELKELAMREYKAWKPDAFIVEKKSNGAPLAQEMRRMGIPLQDFTPNRGSKATPNNKFARVSAVADIVRSGLVWAPEYKWADELIEQAHEFPSGKNDDLVDTLVMALMRFRSGGFISLLSDEELEDGPLQRRSAAYY